jgi:hypothetical protein
LLKNLDYEQQQISYKDTRPVTRLFRNLLAPVVLGATLITSQEAFATDYTPIILVGLLALGVVTIFFAGVVSLFGVGASSSFGLALLIMGVTLFGFWLYPQIKDLVTSPTQAPTPNRGAILDSNEPIT